jgi:hypothetical protein
MAPSILNLKTEAHPMVVKEESVQDIKKRDSKEISKGC